MVKSANLGFPRIGANRELKKAQESYWKKTSSYAELTQVAESIKIKNWQTQASAGIDIIPSNDFSLYDQVLDMISMIGAVPSRYNHKAGNVSEAIYFAMARGAQADGIDVPSMEMSKYFDTNYHYIVPEFTPNQQFSLSSDKFLNDYLLAKRNGFETRPVLIGPITLLLLGKLRANEGGEIITDQQSLFKLLPSLLAIYNLAIKELTDAGATMIQLDEPALITDLSPEAAAAFRDAYQFLRANTKIELHLMTYFAPLLENKDLAFSLPVDLVHLDLVRGFDGFDASLALAKSSGKKLSLGLVEGRNIWINNIEKSIATMERAVATLGSDNVLVAPSCSLLHSPVSLKQEKKLDKELKSWLSFATEKLNEVRLIQLAKPDAANKAAIDSRAKSPLIHNPKIKAEIDGIKQDMFSRKSSYDLRKKLQASSIPLPLLPTTTIGSFPQTPEVRAARADFKSGAITQAEYDIFLKNEIKHAVEIQEKIGIDVLVHGEAERNDMVEYFGEQLDGFAFTTNGWVQSYGSRCVKPPIIFGDIARPKAMTVEWSKYAQSLTKKFMKGMLTGPVTILQWSFVRDDQPREITCKQIGLAIRKEVADLEQAGIKIIQIDEPAIREGLPIRRAARANYLRWAVDCFQLSAAVVSDQTQIHTHMCYSEFNDIIADIARMDADVISIETSRSQMELLDCFVNFHYPNDIGPGVYDIHSPRVPKASEMRMLLDKALKVLAPEQIWVNPDCGLKTRGWSETEQALQEMVAAAIAVRDSLTK